MSERIVFEIILVKIGGIRTESAELAFSPFHLRQFNALFRSDEVSKIYFHWKAALDKSSWFHHYAESPSPIGEISCWGKISNQKAISSNLVDTKCSRWRHRDVGRGVFEKNARDWLFDFAHLQSSARAGMRTRDLTSWIYFATKFARALKHSAN